MTRHNRNRGGFILFIAVAMIPLIGIAVVLLSSDTRMLLGETNLAKRQAYKRNLIASGDAWVRLNRDELLKEAEGFTKELDVTEFDLKQVRCTVTLERITDDEAEVIVKVYHSGDERCWRHTLTLPVEGEDAGRGATIPVASDPNQI